MIYPMKRNGPSLRCKLAVTRIACVAVMAVCEADAARLSILVTGGTRVVPIPFDLKFESLIESAAAKNVVTLLETGLSQERLSA